MTAIVYRDGVMAADRGVWVGRAVIGQMQKIRRLEAGHLVGCAGSPGMADWFCLWFHRGCPKDDIQVPDENGFRALVVTPPGDVAMFNEKMQLCRLVADFHVIGVCSEFLVGACAAGASAEQAVRLALRHTDSATGGIDVLTFAA